MTQPAHSHPSPSTRAPSLHIREKISYGVGDIANGLAVSTVGFWFLIYLTDTAGLSATLAGLAMMIGRLWDAVTDPVMGWISDHTHSRWGKRRPYLFFGAITYSISFFSIWVIPEFSYELSLFIYVTIVVLLFNTFFTVVFVPYTSLTAAMTSDYNERTSLTGYRMTCSQMSFLLGGAGPSALVLWSTSENGIATLNSWGLEEFFGTWAGTARQGYFLTAALFSFIMLVALWTTFFGTREKIAPQSPAKEGGVLGYIKEVGIAVVKNRPFRLAVTILLLANCANTFIGVNLPYYIQYAMGLKSHQTQVVMTLFVCGILAMPFWVFITKRYGKAETYRWSMMLYALVVSSLYFLPEGGLSYLLAVSCLAGFFYAAALMIPWAIIPDVVEYDEFQSGSRREGLFYGGTSFCYKLATALAVFLSGLFLDLIGYVPNQVQSESAVLGIRVVMGFVSALAIVLGVLVAFRYPLTSEKHKALVDALEAQSE